MESLPAVSVSRSSPRSAKRSAGLNWGTRSAKSGATVKLGKEAFYRQAEMDLAAAYAYTSEVMVENMMARASEEGIGAFIAKRQPDWKDD